MEIVKYKSFQWIYLSQPNADDVLAVKKKFNLHPIIVEEFSTPTLRPKVTQFDNYIFLSIHIPLFDTQNKTSYPGEIDIILSKSNFSTDRF